MKYTGRKIRNPNSFFQALHQLDRARRKGSPGIPCLVQRVTAGWVRPDIITQRLTIFPVWLNIQDRYIVGPRSQRFRFSVRTALEKIEVVEAIQSRQPLDVIQLSGFDQRIPGQSLYAARTGQHLFAEYTELSARNALGRIEQTTEGIDGFYITVEILLQRRDLADRKQIET